VWRSLGLGAALPPVLLVIVVRAELSGDDGRKASGLSAFFDRMEIAERAASATCVFGRAGANILAEVPMAEIQTARLPADTKTTKDAAGQFLLSLGHVSRPVSFEGVGTATEILCNSPARQPTAARFGRAQLQAYFPDAILAERDGYLQSLWDDRGNFETALIDFGLSKEFMRTAPTYDRFDPIRWQA